MKRGVVRGIAVTVAAALAAVMIGCSSNPPCETNLAAVEEARQAAVAAEAKIAEAERTKRDLEEQLAAEEARRVELERRKAELEAQVQELSK